MDNQENEKKKSSTHSHDEIKYEMKQGKQKNIKSIFIVSLLLVVIVSVIFIGSKVFGEQKSEPIIITKSTIEKIINVSELNTVQAIYNGIAEVRNEKKPEQIDYYVAYEAKVNAGFDFSKAKIIVDEETQTISVDIQKIVINDVIVDMASLDYIFQNSKANASGVSIKAYSTSIEDVTTECKENPAIFELAEQNAKNIIIALINPFIKQLDSKYDLIVTVGGV